MSRCGSDAAVMEAAVWLEVNGVIEIWASTSTGSEAGHGGRGWWQRRSKGDHGVWNEITVAEQRHGLCGGGGYELVIGLCL